MNREENNSKPSCSSATGGIRVRQRDKILFIGHMSHQITGSKLPSNGQVLRCLFYNLRQVRLNIREAARLTIQEVLIFWEKARIPIRQQYHCIAKLIKLYEEWRRLQRNSSRTSSTVQNNNIEAFKSILDELFDVGHQDALENNMCEEDRKFLILQRQKGRPGCMAGVDLKLVQAEKRRDEKKAAQMARLEKLQQNVDMEFSQSSTSEEEEPMQDLRNDFEDFDEMQILRAPGQSQRNYYRGSEEIVTEKLSILLDRCSISDRDAVRIISATAEALGHDPQQLAISRSTIRNRRLQFRKKRTQLIKNRFKNSDFEGAVLHWDGKLLPDILNRENVERIAVLITCGDEEQLIGVPKLENSMGITQAKAVFSEVEQWGAVEKIEAICFDTTAVNTGRFRGTCVLLEQLFGKDLLYLACRHHILEVILKAIFDCKMGSTTGPQPDIFKRFQTAWSKIDKKKYKTGLEDEDMKRKIFHPDQISNFLLEKLQHHQPRDDYKEFLQLCLIILGRIAPENIHFKVPGAIHHARWMAKAIYSLKIFIFRDQFHLTDLEKNGIRDICLFVINIYVKAWFNAPKASMSPNQDLELLKSIIKYREIDKNISEKALSKMINHLWYLNSEQVAFAFFDETLDKKVKRNMALKLFSDQYCDDEGNSSKKAQINLKEAESLLDKEVDYFVSPHTINFFRRFKINTDFFNSDPDVWSENEDFLKGQKIVKSMKVINDTAERGVKLIQDFNLCLTKDEEQKQYLLQVVSECRRHFPDTSKATLSKPLPPLPETSE